MKSLRFLQELPGLVDGIRKQRDLIIANILLIGQTPSEPVVKKSDELEIENININLRKKLFIERLLEVGVGESSVDAHGNPIGLVKGKGNGNSRKGIIAAAHLDTAIPITDEVNYNVGVDTISGPGIIDNSVSIGILISLPEIIKNLDLGFSMDVFLVGFPDTLGKANLSSARNFINSWPFPVCGAICLEGAELGRLEYFSDGMIRAEISCDIPMTTGWENRFGVNAILIINEVINQIMAIEMPQRPKTFITIGKISGGMKHGDLALSAALGLEIQSSSDSVVRSLYSRIGDIVESIAFENRVALRLSKISDVSAVRLGYDHPLVKSSIKVLNALEIEPIIGSSQSEMSLFLGKGIPAVTIGLTHGENYHMENASIEIEPLFRGIAQLLGIMMAIDSGVCDE